MLALYIAAYNRACLSLSPYESGLDQQSGNMMNRIAFAPVGPTSAPSGSLSKDPWSLFHLQHLRRSL
jgi:hypothetical protein